MMESDDESSDERGMRAKSEEEFADNAGAADRYVVMIISYEMMTNPTQRK
jgi:hypothetical protein